MASIERRTTSYCVKWRLGGKRAGAPQTLTFVFGDEDPEGLGAQELAQKAKAIAEAHSHRITRREVERLVLGEQVAVDLGVPTLDDWGDDWFSQRAKVGDIQPDVLDKYRRLFDGRVRPRLGHLRLTEIGHDTIQDWMAWLKDQKTLVRKGQPARPLSGQTIRRVHSLLHSVLAAAVGEWIPLNPAARPVGARRNSLGLPKVIRYEGMFLEPWELRAILAGCDPEMHDMTTVLVRTGLRLGELLVLRGQDVILTGKNPRIKVDRALKNDGTIGAPKSEASRREVHIAGEALAVLKRRAAQRHRVELLFTAPRGGMWSPHNLRRRHWQPAVAQAQRCAEHPPPPPAKAARGPRRQLRVTEVSQCSCKGVLKRTPRLHDLRHTHVSALVEAGWQPKQIQVRVGHSSFDITMNIYGHLWDGGHGERLDRLEQVLAMTDDESA